MTLCYSIVDSAVMVHAPVPNDHTIHLAKLTLLKQQVVTEHRWWGWTHDLLFGYPMNYTYPWLGYALMLSLDLATGTLFPLDSVYRFSLYFMACLVMLMVYLWARRIGGKCAGFVAALLIIYDGGGAHYGGYLWYDYVGVWACQLALGLHLVFLYMLPGAVHSKSISRASWAGIFLGLSILAHPIAGVASVMAFLAFILSFFTAPALGRVGMTRVFGRLSLVTVIGYSIPAVWILPYLSVRDYAEPFSKAWLSLDEILRAILTGNFMSMSSFLLIGGVLGLAYCLSQTKLQVRIVAVYVLLFIIIGSTTFINATGLGTYLKGFETVRLQMFVRPFFAVACGVLVSLVASKGFPEHFCFDFRVGESFRWKPWLSGLRRRPVLLGMIVLFGWSLFLGHRLALQDLHIRLTPNEPAFSSDTRNALVGLLQGATTGERGFFRVHVTHGEQRPRTLMDLTRELGVPVSFEPFYPVTNIRYGNSRGHHRANISYYGVRFFVTQKALPEDTDWERVGNAGPWIVYHLNEADQHDIVGISKGEGRITNIDITSNRLSFTAQADSQGEIRVFMSPFPRWQLYRDGQRVSWQKIEEEGYPDSAISMPLVSGDYRLVFETGRPERIGLLFSLLGFLLALFCLWKKEITGGWTRKLIRRLKDKGQADLQELELE
jgi:hypothetical protein